MTIKQKFISGDDAKGLFDSSCHAAKNQRLMRQLESFGIALANTLGNLDDKEEMLRQMHEAHILRIYRSRYLLGRAHLNWSQTPFESFYYMYQMDEHPS